MLIEQEYLTTKEAASLLKITTITLLKLTHNGTIRGYKVGRKLRYTREDISESLRQSCNPVNTQPHG